MTTIPIEFSIGAHVFWLAHDTIHEGEVTHVSIMVSPVSNGPPYAEITYAVKDHEDGEEDRWIRPSKIAQTKAELLAKL